MKDTLKPKVGITHGDTNGVGYEVILKALTEPHITEICTPIVYGNRKAMAYYAKALALQMPECNVIKEPVEAREGAVNMIEVIDGELKIEPGVESTVAGQAAFASLERAVTDLRAGDIDALVTAPVDKATIQSDTFRFPGHTEYLEASLGEGDRNHALMILFNDIIRIALVTTHLPVSKIAGTLTTPLVKEKIELLNRSLIEDFGVHAPRIAVLSLNPHAGDGGLLGTEESQVITPAIEEARAEKILAFGPYAADGFFGKGQFRKFDGVLAMYHDQGLTPFKTLASAGGVNFTAGLPYVRTSPDHGTGYDIAAKGEADDTSMRDAIFSAVDILRRRRIHNTVTRNPLRRQYVERNKSDNVVLDLSKDE